MTPQIHTKYTRSGLFVAVGLLLSVFAVSGAAFGQDSKRPPTPSPSESQAVQLPQTPQEHLEMAEAYRKKAAEYRLVADEHRKMLAEYRKKVPQDPRQPLENSYVKKMRLHCERYIKQAEALAVEAEKMAEFHRLRAKELEGR